MTGLDDRFAAGMAAALGPCPPPPVLLLAVSGGGDSTALMALAAAWAAPRGVGLAAAMLDHGLRPEAAAEAAQAARVAANLGIPHRVLAAGSAPPATGNRMDWARRLRHRRLAAAARAAGATAVVLGHTRDDVAETFLARLARGAGVDGLAAMAPRRRAEGVLWLRPMLAIGRDELRALLAERGLPWAEDPTNADPRYDRVRARAALAALATLGIDAAGIAATAARLGDARRALDGAAAAAAAGIVAVGRAGEAVIDAAGLATLDPELRRRIVARVLTWVAGGGYAPRHAALERFIASVLAGQGATLHGCWSVASGGKVVILREPSAVAGLEAPAPGRWDGRWQVDGPPDTGCTIRALGPAGIALRPDWRATRTPRAALLAAPAVWRGSALVAAPLIDGSGTWSVRLLPGRTHPFAADEAC